MIDLRGFLYCFVNLQLITPHLHLDAMKFILSFFISGLIAFSAFAQYLSPAKNFYAIQNDRFDKAAKFRSLLLRGLNDDFEFRYIEFPSFTPTILFQIEAEADGKYLAIVRTSSRSEYTNNRNRGKALYEYKASVDSFDAALFKSVFDGVIDKTHYPVELIIGSDGSTHHFISKFGLNSGIVWSPDSGSTATVIRILNVFIERIKKSKAQASLSENERKTLEQVLAASSYSPKIEDYEWLLSLQKSIQKNKEKYFGSLSLKEQENVAYLLTEMDARIRRQFAFGNINDKSALHSIIYDMENAFLSSILHKRNLDYNNPKYLEFINDNFFRSLIKEFKLEDQINKNGK